MSSQQALTLVRDDSHHGEPAAQNGSEPATNGAGPTVFPTLLYSKAPDFAPAPDPTRSRASGFARTADRSAAPEPAPAAYASAPVRPDRLTVWPTEDGLFGIDVRWYGRECILRAVVVRRLLTDAGYQATAGNSLDGRNWQLTVSPVPADEVAGVIENFIW